MKTKRILDAKRFFVLSMIGFACTAGLVRGAAGSMMLEIDAAPDNGTGATPYYLDYSDGNYSVKSDSVVTWWGEEDVTPQIHVKWHLDVDSDPGITGPIQITNNFGVPTTFTATLTLPVSPAIGVGASMLGSSTISINDGNLDGSATLSAPSGSALYHATIDGVDQKLLFTDPYSLSIASLGGTAGDTQSFTGITTLALTSQIGITNSLRLSPGDIATMNSSFFVGTNVPEPSTFVLLGLACCGLFTRQKLARRITE